MPDAGTIAFVTACFAIGFVGQWLGYAGARWHRDDRRILELLIGLRFLAWRKPRAPDRFAAMLVDNSWAELITTYPEFDEFRTAQLARLNDVEAEGR
jgi:hypothetical protein